MRSDRLTGVALAVALFIFYALGASRTIYVGDSGELVTAVYLLGVPHPSGYPLYVLLGKLWTLLVPVGSIAFRMSLFSAACAAATGGLLYITGRSMGLARTASLFGALLLAVGPSFWSQSNIQRVYTLNALFVLMATAAAWRWHFARGGFFSPASPSAAEDENGRRRADLWLVFAFLICGLGAANHLFMGPVAACLGLFAVLRAPDLLRRVRTVILSGLAFTAGLLPYLYLPIRSRANPRLDWGNPETLEGFKAVVFRESFWERAWIERPADLLVIAADYLAGLGQELAWLGALLMLAGLLAWRRLGLFVLLPLMIMGANFSSMALHGSRVDLFVWHRYYIPSYLMAALLAVAGLDLLLTRWSRGEGSRKRSPGTAVAAVVVAFLIPGYLLATGWSDFDRSRYRVSEAFSRAVFESLPPGADLIATDDNILFTSMYLHLVEGVRPDVNLILQGVGGANLPPLKFNPDEDPVHFTHHPNWNQPGLEMVPVGLTFRAWRAGRAWPAPDLPGTALEGEEDPRVPRDHLTQNLMGHFHYMRGVTYEARDWVTAHGAFLKAAEIAFDNDVLFYNLGLIYRRNGLTKEALSHFEESHRINPRHLASSSKPRASSKIEELRAELESVREAERAFRDELTARGLQPKSAAWHLAMAARLEGAGDGLHGRGHRLRALVAEPAASPGL